MAIRIAFFLINCLLIYGCWGNENSRKPNPSLTSKKYDLITPPLKEKVDSIINLNILDSNSNKENNTEFISYWIMFKESDKNCHLAILPNFHFYDSKEMSGFIKYRGRYLTFYFDSETKYCAKKFITIDSLKEGDIDKLIDYRNDSIPIDPHHSKIFEYKILPNDSLKLVFAGYK